MSMVTRGLRPCLRLNAQNPRIGYGFSGDVVQKQVPRRYTAGMRSLDLKLAASLGLVLCLGAARAPKPMATIYRDAWGTPHVFSQTDQGAVFGMAWALAEDDWPLMEENYLHALGRHAELAGESSIADDWMGRALELAPLSMREYRQASPRIRGLLDAYA